MKLQLGRMLIFLVSCALISGTVGVAVRTSRDSEWQSLAVKAKVGLYNTQTADFEFIKVPEPTPTTAETPATTAPAPNTKPEG